MKKYVIIGGGVSSVACIEGIKSVDKEGKIYLALIEGVKGKKVEMEAYSTVINDFRDFSGIH